MKRFSLTSLRSRLLFLILLAVLPALGLTLYTGLEERRIQEAQVRENTLRLTRLAAGDLVQVIEGARQLLIGLAQLPEVRQGNSSVCSTLFSDLLKQYPHYANLGVIDFNGRLFCSGLAVKETIYLSGSSYLRHALEVHDFSISGYETDPVTRKATIHFGYPVVRDSGVVSRILCKMLTF